MDIKLTFSVKPYCLVTDVVLKTKQKLKTLTTASFCS